MTSPLWTRGGHGKLAEKDPRKSSRLFSSRAPFPLFRLSPSCKPAVSLLYMLMRIMSYKNDGSPESLAEEERCITAILGLLQYASSSLLKSSIDEADTSLSRTGSFTRLVAN